MLIDEGLEPLSEEAAWSLLTGQVHGRIGLSIGSMPVILPVNFGVIDGCIVFRTAPESRLAAAATGAVVAFEVDSDESSTGPGWSVLVVGRSEVIDALDARFPALAATSAPEVDGIRSSLVCIRSELVSGSRRV